MMAFTFSLLFAISRPSSAEYESVIFGVDDFNCRTCCPYGDELSYSAETADDMDTGFELINYDQTTWYSNGAVDGRDWTDDSRRIWGTDDDDPYGTDYADVAVIISHGVSKCSTSTDNAGGYWSDFIMGEKHGGGVDRCMSSSCQDCRIRTNSYYYTDGDECIEYSGHMKYGGGAPNEELNVLIMSTCQSMQKCVWDNGGYAHVDDGGEALQMINGFHGDSHEAWYTPGDHKDYVHYAESNGIGDDWVDKLTKYDDCAVSYVIASSESTATTFYTFGGFKDLKDTGSHNGAWIWFVGGCNPYNGPALPE
jgi:hypothetical protein